MNKAGVRLFRGMVCVLACGCANSSSSVQKTHSIALRKQLVASLAHHREWEAAVEPLLELRREQPHDPEVHALLGTIYREQGLFEQGEAAYREAIRLSPQCAKAHAGLGILREVRRDPGDAAIDDFKTAIRIEPEVGAYYNNLGFALYLRGRYNEAKDALQEGLKRDPSTRRMRNNLGFLYGKTGDYSKAVREFEHGGTEAEANNNIGYVYEQSGDPQTACNYYRAALRLNPALHRAKANAAHVCADPPSFGDTP